MSELILIRHGQASFLGERYDQLSDLGRQQAHQLGRYWATRGMRADAVYVGPRERHGATADAVEQEMRGAGLDWPDKIELAGLDEHGAVDAMSGAQEVLATRFPDLAQLGQDYQGERDPAQRMRAYGRMIDRALRLWVEGHLDDLPGMERWSDFQQRVRAALQQIVAAHTERGRVIVAFTSGGPCAVAAQHALGCNDEVTISLASRVRNASLHRFLFSGERFGLDAFNATPHLCEPQLETLL